MMKKYNWCVAAAALILLLSGCKKDNEPRTAPRYTQFTFPASVSVSFPKPTEKDKENGDGSAKAQQLPDLQFNIDNRAMRMWNKVPLPYESKYDSLDITIVVSSEAVVKILNEKTKKETLYQATRKEQRIDATGGKLKVSIEMKDKPTLTYDLRVLTYGYDPNKFTWTKETALLPTEASEAKALKLKDKWYWVARHLDGTSKLFHLDLSNYAFTELQEAALPEGLITSNLFVDKNQKAWGITEYGDLYSSDDLKRWQQHQQGQVQITQLVGEATIIDGTTKFIALGHPVSSNEYYTYLITPDGLTQANSLPEEFPVKGAYSYTYTQNGVSTITIYSGLTKEDKPALKTYFLSGSIQWGETPYQKETDQVPHTGGLYLHTDKETELFVVGGIYLVGEPTNTIKRSVDKGVTWSLLPKQTTIESDFAPRHNASGLALGYDRSLHIYIFGGIIDDKPSKEIWHGYLDTTGGIINSFE